MKQMRTIAALALAGYAAAGCAAMPTRAAQGYPDCSRKRMRMEVGGLWFRCAIASAKVFTTLACFVFAGCHNGTESNAPPNTSDRMVNGVWSIVGPGIAGRYTDSCSLFAKSAHKQAIAVETDGTIDAGDMKRTLHEFRSWSLQRSIGTTKAALAFDAAGADWDVLVVAGKGNTETRVRDKHSMKEMCASRLSDPRFHTPGAPLYQTLSDLVSSKPQTLACAPTTGQNPAAATVDLAAGTVTLGSRSASLAGVGEEMLSYSGGQLTYITGTGIDDVHLLIFDRHGKLRFVRFLPEGGECGEDSGF